MSKFFLLMVCILTGLLVLACGAPTNRNAEAPSTATSPATAGTPTTTTNRNDNSAPEGDKIGIAECDNFITAYETCVASKVPEAARANLRAAVATWRSDWKKMADNPQTRAGLITACKAQRDATVTAMKAYNCAW
ncbi:MAG TPA: hypothetical protein VLB46_06780 [Pyrinomonadaceae bacterium]|nr:hypothetical protein [Pyrinomonadaceae bacterium]